VKAVGLAVAGWVVPGGAYLVQRRYAQFAAFGILVSITFSAGLALRGGCQWPQPAELRGLDSFTALLFQAGAVAKLLAGGPFLLAQLFGVSSSFLEGRLHEYGTTLLALAGLFNLLAVSDAIESRKGEPR
jgi:hypothetical protein